MRYFLDCEFDGFRGPLISMALVRDDGRSLYFIIDGAEDEAKDPWVITNVLPILRDSPEAPYVLDRATAALAVTGYMDGDEAPHIIADWPADLRYFCDLIEFEGGQMAPLPSFTMEVRRIDAYPTTLDRTATGPVSVQHCAWWDALALRQKVLEIEEATGQPEPGAGPADGPQIGDVVLLMSGGVPMTVTGLYPSGEVRVAWMTEHHEMNETELPAAALRCAVLGA